MIFVLAIECDNAAFDGGNNLTEETARILRHLATRIENGGNYFPIRDENGNPVGGAEFRQRGGIKRHGFEKD